MVVYINEIAMTDPTLREAQRVRHPLKVRRVQVLSTRRLSPNIVSITFGGSELSDFASVGFDDHLKLMLPVPGPNGPELPAGAARPVMRDYTPRRFDTQACELDIEFALHGDGPAASWAAQAQPGQTVGLGGPRGSFVVPLAFDWYLMIGDETALPAIARRLQEFPAGTKAVVVLAVDPADQRPLDTAADVALHWVSPEREALLKAVTDLTLPSGDGHAWAAGEAGAMAKVREVLIDHHGVARQHCRCSAYWKAGTSNHHENLQDSAPRSIAGRGVDAVRSILSTLAPRRHQAD